MTTQADDIKVLLAAKDTTAKLTATADALRDKYAALVQERVEALCLDSRHGSHGCTGRCVPACVVQHRCEIFGDCAIEA